MVFIVNGKVYFNGMLLGVSNHINDGVINIGYDKPRIYVVN